MSFITPKRYRELANTLGTAYGVVRDALHSSGDDDDEDIGDATAYGYAKYIVDNIVDATDDNSDADSYITHSVAKDPSGSIASDLGSSATSFANSLIKTSSKTKAASYFTSILQKINSHVIKRTNPNLLDPPTIRTIREYYDEYSLTTGSADMSLHSNDGAAYNSDLYFNADFVDLLDQINIDLSASPEYPYKQS